MKSKDIKFKTGSTVIEVLIATTIVAFALTALAMLMTNNVKNSAEADYREAAAGVAQDAMESIRQIKNTTTWSSFSANRFTAVCGTTQVRYNTTFYITCPTQANNDSPDTKTVTIEVCWPSLGTSCAEGAKTTKIVQRFYNN